MANLLSSKTFDIPEKFDTDSNLKAEIPLSMFGNDEYGDCVMVGRANQTLRFEYFQQKQILPITTDMVLKEYWSEEGGIGPDFDNGLLILDALKEWKNKGWEILGKNYTIYSFAEIIPKNINEVKASICYLNGIMTGVELPNSSQDQIGKVWEVTTGPDAEFGSWGGHCVFVCGYTPIGPICITWAAKQQMTWDWFTTYCSEAYAVICNKDSWVINNPLNIPLLEGYLQEIEKM